MLKRVRLTKLDNPAPAPVLTEHLQEVTADELADAMPKNFIQRMFPDAIQRAAMKGKAQLIEAQFTLYNQGFRTLRSGQIDRLKEAQFQILTREAIAGRFQVTKELIEERASLATVLRQMRQHYVRTFNQDLEEIEAISDEKVREEARKQLQAEFSDFLTTISAILATANHLISDTLLD